MVLFLQVYKQNTTLKAEVSQLKSSKKQLSNEFSELKDKYQSLSQDFEKMTFINEAEQVMDQLEEILIEVKLNFTKLPFLTKHKVCLLCFGHPYCIVCVNMQYNLRMYLPTYTIKFKGQRIL